MNKHPTFHFQLQYLQNKINGSNTGTQEHSPCLADAGVVVDAVHTLATVHAAAVRAVFIVRLTVDAREP